MLLWLWFTTFLKKTLHMCAVLLVCRYGHVCVSRHKGPKKSERLERNLQANVSWCVWVLKTKFCSISRELCALRNRITTPVQILAFNSLHQLLLKSASIAKCFHIGILAWWKRHTGLEEGSVLSVYFWKSFYERSKWPTRVIRVHKRNDVDCC